jgi:hypothetical protein
MLFGSSRRSATFIAVSCSSEIATFASQCRPVVDEVDPLSGAAVRIGKQILKSEV